MRIVIPLGKGSAWQDGELLYALRSYEMHVPHDSMLIVGDKPKWIKNVDHIPMEDLKGRRAWNIARKVLRACEELTEPFMFTNDDIYAVQHITKLPNYHCGLMSEQKNLTSGFEMKVRATAKVLQKDALFFDVHTPMMISPVLFKNIMGAYDYARNEFIMKSLYGNNVMYPVEQITDCKIRRGLTYHEVINSISGRDWFSIGDGGLNTVMKKVLQELYPHKSKYES